MCLKGDLRFGFLVYQLGYCSLLAIERCQSLCIPFPQEACRAECVLDLGSMSCAEIRTQVLEELRENQVIQDEEEADEEDED